jgi:uncharacterized membrane protein HdeD (DUF308 family)
VLSPLIVFVMGAAAALSTVAALFFLRFFRETRDALFAWFAAAFALEAIDRAIFALAVNPSEADPRLYVIRVVAYALILVGVYQKNHP